MCIAGYCPHSSFNHVEGSLLVSHVRKMKWSWLEPSAASKTIDVPRVSPLGDHMTGKDDKGDQPSGGETTWTNTGATRYGRGQRNTG